MWRLLMTLCLCAGISNLVHASEEVFVYNDHGKRDPFSPLVTAGGSIITYDSELTVAELSLEGVMMDPSGKNLAIVNGKIVKENDVIGPYVVQVISEDHVDLLKDTETHTLKIKKGGM